MPECHCDIPAQVVMPPTGGYESPWLEVTKPIFFSRLHKIGVTKVNCSIDRSDIPLPSCWERTRETFSPSHANYPFPSVCWSADRERSESHMPGKN